MRNLTIIFFLILSFDSFAQKVNSGTFFTSKKDIGFESEVFQFFDDLTFNYIFFTCTGTGFGKGSYQIDESDSLILQFKNCDTCTEFVDVTKKESQGDSVKIQLTILDYYGNEPLSGVNCYIKESKIGWVTGYDGRIEGKFPKVDSSQTLRIQFIGYEPVEIPVTPLVGEISGEVRLTDIWIYSEVDTIKYEIKKLKKNKLRLKRYSDFSISYDRIPQRKVKKQNR
jgi:hypothetical protein